MSWWIGLDLGQAVDYTALACIEQTKTDGIKEYALRHLQRFPIGTSYPDIVSQVGKIINQPPLAGCKLVPDATGVGRAVTDLLRTAGLRATIIPITITGGIKATADGRGGVHVPKRELVSVLQVLLQTHRLKIPATMPLAGVLVRELQTFKVKVTEAANETYGAWRERDHDDLVLATALALWLGQNFPEPYTGPLVYWPPPPPTDPPPTKSWIEEVVEQMDRDDERQDRWHH